MKIQLAYLLLLRLAQVCVEEQLVQQHPYGHASAAVAFYYVLFFKKGYLIAQPPDCAGHFGFTKDFNQAIPISQTTR